MIKQQALGIGNYFINFPQILSCYSRILFILMWVDVALYFCSAAGKSWCVAMWFDPGTIRGQGEEDFQEGTHQLIIELRSLQYNLNAMYVALCYTLPQSMHLS